MKTSYQRLALLPTIKNNDNFSKTLIQGEENTIKVFPNPKFSLIIIF